MSNKLQRILKRDKPKADILENMTRTWFKNSDAPEAIVTIKPNTASRSVKQNAFYWRIVSIIADDTGNSPDALHTYFSSQFLEPLIEEVNNKPVVVIKSTTKLTVNETGKVARSIFCKESMAIIFLIPRSLEKPVRSTNSAI